MKLVRELIFAIAAVIALSVSVSAQKKDDKKPPKPTPPVVTPGDKKPPKEAPPRDKGKKPGMGFVLFVSRSASDGD